MRDMLSLVVDGRQNQESSGDSLLGHSQRLCTHVWRQDVPILPVALPFPSKTHVSSSSKASAASSASAMATGHKDLHRPTHTNGHVAQYGGDQDAMDERCDDGDNQSRARRRRGRWQRRRESPRWSKSRAALFSLANGQVTATPSADSRSATASLRPRAAAVSKQWG